MTIEAVTRSATLWTEDLRPTILFARTDADAADAIVDATNPATIIDMLTSVQRPTEDSDAG